MKKVFVSIFLGIALVGIVSFAQATPIVAYDVPSGTAGNQDYGEALGMYFDVNSDINVFSLGVFDDSSDGLKRDITVRLYDRTATSSFLVEKIFPVGNTGTLNGGSRFLDLDSPLFLSAGFEGAIVAYGYGSDERNGNKGVSSPGSWTTNDGGGLISFVGKSAFRGAGYPTKTDTGPADRYAAGTFAYAPVPEPSTLVLLGGGLLGLGFYTRREKQK